MTTPTSGAADLRDTLINIAREIEALKRECGMDPESPIAIQNGRYMALSYKVRALAAGQATAAQPDTAYAALPSHEHQLAIMEGERNASLDAYSRVVYLTGAESRLYEAGFTNGWDRRDRLASYGQAPSGATQREFGQFLSDVMTAAGLVTHGKKCKALGDRLADMCMRLRRWGQPEPKPSPVAQGDALDAARYRFLAAHCRSTSEHWDGRWSIIVDGPEPKSHDSEDDFDAAIDAARKEKS